MSEAFHIAGAERAGRWLITCDHATNHVPDWVGGGSLGLAKTDMARHIAFDPGAKGVALALGECLNSPVISSNFSRLVIDPNRGLLDPTLVMRLYDGSIIPENRAITQEGIQERIARLYQPYHDAYEALARGPVDGAPRVIVALHSFTRSLQGRAPRPWQIGILHSYLDSRLSKALISRLCAEGDLCVGDNEPYNGHLPGDAIDQHALAAGRHNTLIELRNDLIETEADQKAWAARLAPLLIAALQDVTDG